MDRNEWSSAVSDCGHPQHLIAGYRLPNLIGRLTYTQVLFLCLRGRLPDGRETRMLDALLCAIVDYAIGPAPFAARVVASANPQMQPALAAGILAQGAHAISPQEAAEFLLRMQAAAASYDPPAAALPDLAARLRAARERIPGIGHPSQSGRDPRAERLREVAQELGFWGETAAFYTGLVEQYNRLAGKSLAVNVDGALACLLLEMGFTPLQMAGIAALSTMPGLIAHTAADISGGVRIRQVQGMAYTGPAERDLPPEHGGPVKRDG